MRIPAPLPDEQPLAGWKEIADYLGVSRDTVDRWSKHRRFPLPYHITMGHPWAVPSELQVWLRHHTIPGSACGTIRQILIKSGNEAGKPEK